MSQATLLLAKRREVYEVNRMLEEKKAAYARRVAEFARREAEIAKKDQELQDALSRFHKFVQENEHKRTRADRKAAEESAAAVALHEEAAELTKQLAKLRAQSLTLAHRADTFSRYDRFLKDVLAASAGELQDRRALLSRYETLRVTHAQLEARSEEVAAETELLQAERARLGREQAASSMTLVTSVNQLRKQRETVQDAAHGREASLHRQREAVAASAATIGEVREGIDNLAARCIAASRIRRPKIQSGDVEGELMIVRDFIDDLRYMASKQALGAGGAYK
jgi:chromosome segregation ATPase